MKEIPEMTIELVIANIFKMDDIAVFDVLQKFGLVHGFTFRFGIHGVEWYSFECKLLIIFYSSDFVDGGILATANFRQDLIIFKCHYM